MLAVLTAALAVSGVSARGLSQAVPTAIPPMAADMGPPAPAYGPAMPAAAPAYGAPMPAAPAYGSPGGYGAAPGNCSFRFGQCSGSSWTGPTACCGDNVCTEVNSFFGQCLAAPLPVNVAPEGGKCGGAGWAGPFQCEKLTQCTFVDAATSLCQSIYPPVETPPAPARGLPGPPGPGGVQPSSAVSPPPPLGAGAPRGFNASACSFRYQQCGGTGYAGPTCCHGDNACVRESEWWSGCRPAPLAAGVLREFEKCAGTGFSGAGACEALTTCVPVSDQESQCRSIFPAPPAPPEIRLPPRPDGLVRRYGQCQGLVWSKKCEPGNECVKQNVYYSQCLPTKLPAGVRRKDEHCWSNGSADEPCEAGTTCTHVDEFYGLCMAAPP